MGGGGRKGTSGKEYGGSVGMGWRILSNIYIKTLNAKQSLIYSVFMHTTHSFVPFIRAGFHITNILLLFKCIHY